MVKQLSLDLFLGMMLVVTWVFVVGPALQMTIAATVVVGVMFSFVSVLAFHVLNVNVPRARTKGRRLVGLTCACLAALGAVGAGLRDGGWKLTLGFAAAVAFLLSAWMASRKGKDEERHQGEGSSA
jgi:hypothetical protein